jgi:hypothetical protein
LGSAKIDAASALGLVQFLEPRDVCPLDRDNYLLTTIDRLLHVDATGRILREYTHPYFAFLHSVTLHPGGKSCLIVSSGYDALIELECADGTPSWEWFGWEHSFNPAPDGTFLTRSAEEYARLIAAGTAARLVDPSDYGPQGLVTAARSTHPSSACYAGDRGEQLLVCLGQLGRVAEIDRRSGRAITRVDGLHQLPHAILPDEQGWMVTDTMAGELWRLDRKFRIWARICFASLPGKPNAMADHEWLQAVVPLTHGLHLAIDGNRGLVVVDLARRLYRVQGVYDDWSIQTAIPV